MLGEFPNEGIKATHHFFLRRVMLNDALMDELVVGGRDRIGHRVLFADQAGGTSAFFYI